MFWQGLEKRGERWHLRQVRWDHIRSGSHSAGRLSSWDGNQVAQPPAWHWEKEGRSLFLTLFGPQLWQLLWLAGEILPVTVSKDCTCAAKVIVTGLQQWWATDCAIPFLALSLCQLAPCRQCPCTPVDSMSERCLFWNKEGKKAWPQEGMRHTMLSRTSTWSSLLPWVGVTRRLSSPSPCGCVGFTYMTHSVDFCIKACAASPALVPMQLFKDVDGPQTWGNEFNSVIECILSRKFSEQLLALATAWKGSVPRSSLKYTWFSEYSPVLAAFPHSHRPVSSGHLFSPHQNSSASRGSGYVTVTAKCKYFPVVFAQEQSLKQIIIIESLC